MIKANELRIGNYLHYNSDGELKDHKIDGQDIFLIESDNSILKSHTPIPLTEEWLLKFGFKHWVVIEDKKERIHKEYFVHPSLPDNIRYYLPYHNLSYYIGYVIVAHVHQLQNLYFALTEKELTIND